MSEPGMVWSTPARAVGKAHAGTFKEGSVRERCELLLFIDFKNLGKCYDIFFLKKVIFWKSQRLILLLIVRSGRCIVECSLLKEEEDRCMDLPSTLPRILISVPQHSLPA